jgi:hypothetical protein
MLLSLNMARSKGDNSSPIHARENIKTFSFVTGLLRQNINISSRNKFLRLSAELFLISKTFKGVCKCLAEMEKENIPQG